MEAIRLSDPDGSDPGRVAWLEGAELHVGTEADLPTSSGTPQEAVTNPGTKITGQLNVKWQKNEFQSAVTETGTVRSVILADKKDELEVRCLVLKGEAGSFRSALAWRVRRKGLAVESGSAVFRQAEGKETVLDFKGAKRDTIQAKLTLSTN